MVWSLYSYVMALMWNWMVSFHGRSIFSCHDARIIAKRICFGEETGMGNSLFFLFFFCIIVGDIFLSDSKQFVYAVCFKVSLFSFKNWGKFQVMKRNFDPEIHCSWNTLLFKKYSFISSVQCRFKVLLGNGYPPEYVRAPRSRTLFLIAVIRV